jgi:hypothetical protein
MSTDRLQASCTVSYATYCTLGLDFDSPFDHPPAPACPLGSCSISMQRILPTSSLAHPPTLHAPVQKRFVYVVQLRGNEAMPAPHAPELAFHWSASTVWTQQQVMVCLPSLARVLEMFLLPTKSCCFTLSLAVARPPMSFFLKGRGGDKDSHQRCAGGVAVASCIRTHSYGLASLQKHACNLLGGGLSCTVRSLQPLNSICACLVLPRPLPQQATRLLPFDLRSDDSDSRCHRQSPWSVLIQSCLLASHIASTSPLV